MKRPGWLLFGSLTEFVLMVIAKDKCVVAAFFAASLVLLALYFANM